MSPQSGRRQANAQVTFPFNSAQHPSQCSGASDPQALRSNLLTLVNLICIMPYRHAQRLVSSVILDPMTLTINTNFQKPCV